MSPTAAAASGFVLFLLFIQVVQGQDDWGVTYPSKKVCASKGSTVELSSTYTHPAPTYGQTSAEKSFWFTKERNGQPVDLTTDSEYTGRVTSRCYEKRCTLRITDLRGSDSAVYKFRLITDQPDGRYTGTAGVTLSVTVLQVHMSFSLGTAKLKCHSSCPLPPHPSFIWYKNGERIHAGTSSSYSEYYDYPDSYSCALLGHEDSPSPPACPYNDRCNRVTYTDRRICAPKGSSVDISCTYNSHKNNGAIKSKFWFSPELSGNWQSPSRPEDLRVDSQYAGRVQVLETKSGHSALRISDLRESGSVEYRFRFTSGWGSSLPGTTLTVTALQVQVQVITAGESYTNAELRCLSSCSPPGRLSYVWFRNREKINGKETSSFTGQISLRDEISCAFKGHDRFPSPPVYAPKTASVSVSPSDEVRENTSVTLTCSSDANPAAVTYTWYKNRNPDFQPFSKEAQLVFHSIQPSDSGEYYCEAENKLGKRTSEHLTIDVKYSPKLHSVSVSPSGEIVENSSVTLTCSSHANPAAVTYTWYKNGNPDFQPFSKEAQLVFSSIQPSDSGQYHCDAVNKLGKGTSEHLTIDVKYAPKLTTVSVNPSAGIMEGSSLTLTCSSDANPAAKHTLYKKNQTAPFGQQGLYRFTSISPEDRGIYYCTSENQYGRISSPPVLIDVYYGPKLPSVSVTGEIVEGSSVSLTCKSDANPAATNTWYKEDHTPLQGQEGIHSFTSLGLKDSGIYYCKSENGYGQKNSTSVHIDVQYPPRLPCMSMNPSGEIMEGSSVTLNCSSDANPAANYTWYKGNDRTPQGSGPIFTINDVTSEHSGGYYCEADNRRGRHNSTLHFVVVSSSMKSVAAGSISAIFLVIIFLLVILFIRRKRSLKETNQPGESPDNNGELNMASQSEPTEELCYASVRFSKNPQEALYSNFSPAKPNRPKKKKEEDDGGDVEYARVNIKSKRPSSRSRTQMTEEDVSALYSTVVRTPRV